MININDLVIFLEDYKINNKFTFHRYCVDTLKKITGDKHIHKIQQKSYLLYSLRLYLLNNIDSYDFVLSKYKYVDCTYLKIKLNDNEINNLLTIIELMETERSNILKINNVDHVKIKKELDIQNSGVMYLNIINKKEPKQMKNYKLIKNYYDTLSFLLGIETFNILKFQRLDRIKNFIKNDESYKVYEILQQYNNMIHELTFEERDNYIIHSGSVLEVIGTTYTRDVDVIVFKPDHDPNYVKDLLRNIGVKYKDIDASIIDKYGEYHTNPDEEPLKYRKQWLTYMLPASDGASDIYEVATNPVHHFCFAGMKFFSINLTVNRFLQRASISSMADMIMLYELNGFDIKDRICLPNITVRQGKLVVFYGKYLETYFINLQKSLKEYYNKIYSIDELKKIVKHCNDKGFDIYKGAIVKDPDTDIIKYFHIMIKLEIYKKYARNAKYLLDMGTGKLTDMRMWDSYDIRNVVGIEPSVESLKMGRERLEKHGFRGKLDLVNGVGDDDWTKDTKYDIVLQNKYDVITFQYTLHYMMNNIETVLSNMKKVLLPKCKIIITCMDGNKIQNDFIKYKHIEVRNRQEPIFAIYPMYEVANGIPEKNNNIIVYFKGAYGVSSGSIEPIIDINKLIDIFKNNNIKLLERKNFADYDIQIKKKLHPVQLRVSSYYMSLVFEYE